MRAADVATDSACTESVHGPRGRRSAAAMRRNMEVRLRSRSLPRMRGSKLVVHSQRQRHLRCDPSSQGVISPQQPRRRSLGAHLALTWRAWPPPLPAAPSCSPAAAAARACRPARRSARGMRDSDARASVRAAAPRAGHARNPGAPALAWRPRAGVRAEASPAPRTRLVEGEGGQHLRAMLGRQLRQRIGVHLRARGRGKQQHT